MAAPAINRLVLTDDDGTGLTGTPLNNALFQDLQNRIDQLSAAIVAQFPAPANILTPSNLPATLQNLAASRTITYNGAPAVWRQLDPSLHDVMVLNNQDGVVYIAPPVSSNANGVIAPRDEQSIVYRIRDSGVAQPISWDTGGGAWPVPMNGIPLPGVTLKSQTLHIGMRYSTLHGRWFVVAMAGDQPAALERGDLREVIEYIERPEIAPLPIPPPEPK